MTSLLRTAIVLAIAVPLSAQQPLFKSSIEVVELDVSVTRDGRPVAGLSTADFIVTDNGVAQEITSVTLERLPLDITLVLDISRSVRGVRLTQLLGAAHGLAASLRAADRAGLFTFSHEIRHPVALTRNRDAFERGLEGLNGAGSTSLRDAVHLALQQGRREDGRRALILLFSDGRDTTSWLTEPDVIESARRALSVVHIVRFESDAFLDRLADASGGRNWSANSESDLKELFGRALDEMRSRYLLRYSPRGVEASGWHSLQVRLRRQRADIVARPGYLVP